MQRYVFFPKNPTKGYENPLVELVQHINQQSTYGIQHTRTCIKWAYPTLFFSIRTVYNTTGCTVS